jgi:hypothetical protein
MKWLAILLSLVIAAIGILGVAAPTVLLDAARLAQSQVVLYVIAALRIAFGLILIGAAAASRLPRTLRILGAFIVLAGIITPFFGIERTQAMVEWWAAQGTAFMRGWAAIAILIGLFIAFAVAPRRRAGRDR